MKLKSLICLICKNLIQKQYQHLWDWWHLGWTITLWSEKSLFQICFVLSFGKKQALCLWEQIFKGPGCYQQQVQQPDSMVVRGCTSTPAKGHVRFCDAHRHFRRYSPSKTAFPQIHCSRKQFQTISSCIEHKLLIERRVQLPYCSAGS